jgi:hypothetical protein
MKVGVQRHAPAALPPGKITAIHCTGGWVGSRGPSGRVWKISPQPGFRFPDRPVRSDSLYGLIINLLKPIGYVTHQQFNIQQLYVLPTQYLCVLYLSENKQRLVPLTA